MTLFGAIFVRNEGTESAVFMSRNPGTNYTVIVVALTEMSGVGMQQMSLPQSISFKTGKWRY